jgi:hypothetical protein
MSYEEALQQLAQVPTGEFLAARKRLTAALRAQGDEHGAAQLAKRAKPVTSVWAVNQLYWQARPAFDAMLAAAARVRAGDLTARKAHYDAIAALRRRAAALLADAGHGASDTTLRRIATTLAAIAASGDFSPDPPGALSADRDPPGFDAVAAFAPSRPNAPVKAAEPVAAPAVKRPTAAEAREHARAEALARAAEAAERKRREAERARAAARARLATAIRAARSELDTRARERASLEGQLRRAEERLAAARDKLEQLERALAALEAERDAGADDAE